MDVILLRAVNDFVDITRDQIVAKLREIAPAIKAEGVTSHTEASVARMSEATCGKAAPHIAALMRATTG
jgi:hypothetical protein